MTPRSVLVLAALSAVPIAHAQTSASAPKPKADDVVTLEKFSVEDRITNPTVAIGTDRTRNTISITREALLAAPAGISALKVLESLPGFNVQTSDALGLYEFGNSVSVRTFNYQQIGFILDGAPLGRSDQFGGSPIYRYVDNENLARVTASQGTGEVSQPGYASLGPVVEYSTLAPAAKPSAQAVVTLGSNDLERTFFKAQSGKWNGFAAFISRSKQTSDQWRGPGTFDREHWDGALRYEVSSSAWLQFKATYNDYFDYDSPAISKAQYYGTAGDAFGRSGRYFGYLGTVPVLAQTTPGIVYSNALYNQFYKQAINARTDKLYNLSGHAALSSEVKLNATAYYEDKDGYGVSPEAYATSLASYNAERLVLPGLVAPRGLQYGLSTVDGIRKGVTASLVYTAGAQELSAGFWLERDNYHRTQNRYNQVDGNPDGAPLLNERVHRQRDFVSVRDSTQFFVRDTIKAGDNLKIEVGAKSLNLDYSIEGARNPADFIALRAPKISTTWKDSFLPQVGATYALTPSEQFFASFAQNLALPRGADDIFALASPAAPAPAAETSDNFELGLRTNRGEFNASIAVYATKFDNRLQSFASVVPGSTTTETYFQNVGAVKAHGAEVSAAYRPGFLARKVAFNANASYNVSEFKDNFPGFALAGLAVPDSPKWIFQTSATYEPVRWAAFNVAAHTVGSRYSNFLNTERVGGYTTFSLYADLGGSQLTFGPLKQIKFRVNVDNVTNKDYFGTISVAQSGALATFRPGPDRTYQVTVSASF